MLTLLCPVIALGTSGLPLAPSSEQCVLAAALPTTSVGALFLFTVMQQPQGLTGLGGWEGAEQAQFPLVLRAVLASTFLGERMLG